MAALERVKASADAHVAGEVWWRAEVPLHNPVVSYRWLMTGGRLGYRWLNGAGSHRQEVSPADDFKLSADPGGPDEPPRARSASTRTPAEATS